MMALVTVQRSPSPSSNPESDVTDGEDTEESKSQIRQRRSKAALKKLKKLFNTVRFVSKLRPCFSESYFTVKGAALILPQNDYEGFYTRRLNTSNGGGDIQKHLQAMFCWLRPEDTIKLAVRLESNNPKYIRYMVVMSCSGCHDTEEAAVLGLDLNDELATIGLVFPIWAHTKLDLEGDGGFSITPEGRPYNFQPVSVQAMWSALQSLNKVLKVANDNLYLPRGLTHTWVGYYSSRIESEKSCIAEWNKLEDLHMSYRHSPEVVDDADQSSLYKAIKTELKNVMMRVDFEEVTTKFIREAVEETMGMSLKEHRNFIDLEIINIMGQMDAPTKIEEYLYLGSEWNASNLEELEQNGVGHILNVSREIDNFFPEVLSYMNVREWDVKEANLLRYWEDTHKFITQARQQSSKTLVHCKMGISRSASTVIAFLMKEHNWSRQEAFDYTKARRSIINPNEGFWKQLETYEGILTASRQRKLFLEKSAQDLRTAIAPQIVDPDVAIDLGSDLEIPQDADLLLRQKLGKTASGSEKDDLILKFEPEIDNVSRSTDSTEESLSDIPSPVITEAPSGGLSEFTDPKLDTKKVSSSDLADSETESLKGSKARCLSGEDEKNSKISVPGVKPLSKDGDKSRSSTEGTSIIDPSRLSAEMCSLLKFKSDRSWIKEGAGQKEEEGEKEEKMSEVCGSVDKLGETVIGEKDKDSRNWIEFRNSNEKIQIGEEKEVKAQIKKVKEEDEFQAKDIGMDPSRVANTKYTSGEAMKYVPERMETSDISNKEPRIAGCVETQQRGCIETAKFTCAENAGCIETSQKGSVETTNTFAENALCSSVEATKSENMESTKPGNAGISKSSTILGLAIKEHYTKENIPWNAGTVLKQRQDFEERCKPAIDCDRVRTESISSDTGSQASLSPTLQKKEKLSVKLSPSDDSAISTVSSHVSVELRTDTGSKNISRPKIDDVSKIDSGLVSYDWSKTVPFVDSQKVDIEEHAKQTGSTDEDAGADEKEDEGDGPNSRARLSVYDMEDIQLPPGIVRRTTKEIEERHNILTDTSDSSQKCPVKRSSSLKAKRVTPKSKDRDSERRKTCMAVLSPTSSNSDLKTPESSLREAVASCTIMDSPTDCTVPVKCCLDFEFEKEMPEKGDNSCLSGEQAAIKVYKLFGEEVTVQEGLVKKQKMDIEAMERDVGKRAQTRTNQADVPNLSSPTKSALLTHSLPQTTCSDAITQANSGIPKTSFSAQSEANFSTKTVQTSDKNIVLNLDQGISTDLILSQISSQNKCNFENSADISKSFAELKQGFDSKCSTNSAGSEGSSLKKSQSGVKKSPKPERRFDEETLELIREIGSALLNSPSKAETEDETDISKEGSLVKHLVKNIERKTRAMKKKPSKEIIIVDRDAPQKRKLFNEESKSKEISVVVESSDISPKYSCPAGVVPKSAKSSYNVTPATVKTGLLASESKIIPDVSADVHQSHENPPQIQQQYLGIKQIPAESTTVTTKEECKTSTWRDKTPVTDDTELCSVKNLVGKFESPDSHSKLALESSASVSGLEFQSDKPVQIVHKSVSGDLLLKARESEKTSDFSLGSSSKAVTLREKLVKFARMRPKSADNFRAMRVEEKIRGPLQQSKTLPESETKDASTLSWQGRKVRKLYGKSHPLSKLEQGHGSIRKSPFYSTM